jgi:hypothetical protein
MARETSNREQKQTSLDAVRHEPRVTDKNLLGSRRCRTAKLLWVSVSTASKTVRVNKQTNQQTADAADEPLYESSTGQTSTTP